MTFRAGFIRGLLIALTLAVLSGCTPSSSGQLDEEKEPHYLAGKNRISTLDYKGAVECFEKALQVNPRSASAHFELAWIFDGKLVDPAAAIYHYQHYLQLSPSADNADLARQRIASCKQALAETVSLLPITEKMQRQFERLTEENKRLTEENKRLKDDLEKWSSYAARLPALTNPPAAAAAPVTPVNTAAIDRPAATEPVEGGARSRHAALPAGAGGITTRTHTVRPGETPTQIARHYGLKLDALMAANPKLDARRLRVGQVLRIPGS